MTEMNEQKIYGLGIFTCRINQLSVSVLFSSWSRITPAGEFLRSGAGQAISFYYLLFLFFQESSA